MSNGKEFQNVWLRKKKDLLRLLMLVVVEAIFDTNERLSRSIKIRFSLLPASARLLLRVVCTLNKLKKISGGCLRIS